VLLIAALPPSPLTAGRNTAPTYMWASDEVPSPPPPPFSTPYYNYRVKSPLEGEQCLAKNKKARLAAFGEGRP
jgi:hypothetical protein